MFKALTRSVVASLVLLALVIPLRAAEEKPKDKDKENGKTHPYIVLVGINDYADKQILPRKHAEQDAQALYDIFTSKDYLGVEPDNIKLLLGKADEKRKSEPATHANIMKALRWAGKANRDDLVIVALFMQGAPKGERPCYFATDSTFKDRAKNAVLGAEIEQAFEKTTSQHFCVFLDVNFKGFDAGKEAAPDVNLQNLYREFLGNEDNGTQVGRMLFIANTGLKPSFELENHGLFAKVLIDGLKGAADKEGYEPDGVVIIDELIEYLDKEIPPLVAKIGKNKEERDLVHHILGSRTSHFELTNNPAVMPKVTERIDKLKQLAKDNKISKELAEEGQNLLSRMPKLESYRTLRKDYQKLVDGSLTVEEFQKDRTKIFDAMKFKRSDALAFAAKVIQASQQVREEYVKEINQGEMISWAIRGLYRRIDEKVPKEIDERLGKIKQMKEEELTQLLADVRERLGNREDLDKHKDIDFALQSMLGKLDPYTTYIDPETVDRFRQETDANFTGIGVQIRKDTGRDMLTVVTPIKGSPAYKAGIKTGDVITKIVREMDSKGNPLTPPEVISTKGLALSEAVKKILGKENTKVKLTVEREGADKPLEFEITRGLVEVETVTGAKRRDDDSWDYWLDHDNRIAYIRVSGFATNTFRDLIEVLVKLEKKGIKGMVLDLRFNPGGLLTSAVEICDLFIDDGLIVSIRPRVGKERSFNGRHEASLLNFPMVVLVNGGSASGSEIVAACLQDHHRAVVMGERSFGKGSVQNIMNFEGGRLKLTTASFWRPSGKNLNKSSTAGKDDDDWGVIPDTVLKLSPKERDDLAEHQRDTEIIPRRDAPPKEAKPEFKDKQLDKAMDYLRSQIKLVRTEPTTKKVAK